MAAITVFADDLTGALDAGVKFTGGGRRVVVAWHAAQPDCDVLAFDSSTRETEPPVAAAQMAGWALRATGFVYKKMDSTLRGPFVAESLALAAALGCNGVLFAPASPGSGRCVVGGRLLVHDRPLEQTAFWRDPRWPVSTGDLLACIGCAYPAKPALLDLDCVRRGAQVVAQELVSLSGVVVADAESDSDLDVLAQALLMVDGWLPVGSAGLAGAIARALGWKAEPALRSTARPELVVCGSSHPVSREQVLRLAAFAAIVPLEARAGGAGALAGAAGEACAARGLAAMAMPQEQQSTAEAAAALTAMADAAVAVLRQLGLGCVFVTGGKTLRLLADRLGLHTLHLVTELNPGVVLSRGETDDGRRLLVISKAGGFGDPDLLVRLASEHGT